MGGISRQTMIAGFVGVAVLSAILGGLLALALFQPAPEIREVLVEVEPTEPIEPPLTPDQEDLDRLVERYIDLSGTEEDWTVSLVEEIGAAVCDGGLSGVEVKQELGLFGELEIEQAQLDVFVDEVRVTCPTSEES